MALKIKPLGPPLGAEVTGLNVAAGIADSEFEKIIAAFHSFQVLVFRDQALSPEAQVNFARRFGPLENQPGGEHTIPGFPELLILSNDLKDGQPVGRVDAGDYWHSDSSHRPVPAMATVLYAVKNPSQGGDTDFANMYLAFEALSKDMQRRLEGLNGIHVSSKLANKRVAVSENRPGAREFYEKLSKTSPPVAHPLVRTHPATGRKCLYASPRFTVAIEGMNEAEADAILDALFAHQIKPEFIYRHKWRDGDLVIWDNRCLIHHATGGYDYPDIRTMHRAVISGDAPY